MEFGGFFLMFCFLASVVAGCDRCIYQSRASCHVSSSAVTDGECGYGSSAMELNGGYIAAGSPVLFREGIGCGACFQIRCKNVALCNSAGVNVVLTGQSKNNRTDLVLSKKVFTAMAKKGMDRRISALGIVDVEYRRVPCEYKNHNLSLVVDDSSRNPKPLAVKFLYQGGQTEIVAVDVARVGSFNWKFMTREYGVVWSTSEAPVGPLQFRVVVTGGYDGKWVWAEKEVLPRGWKTGVVYDSGVQITDVAKDNCFPCDDTSEWKMSQEEQRMR